MSEGHFDGEESLFRPGVRVKPNQVFWSSYHHGFFHPNTRMDVVQVPDKTIKGYPIQMRALNENQNGYQPGIYYFTRKEYENSFEPVPVVVKILPNAGAIYYTPL